jgi:tRNA pseudouridine(38-40) synthase
MPVLNRNERIDLSDENQWEKYAILISYTGTYFYGVQLQARVVAIQSILWEAMKNLRIANKFSQLGMHFASRTDRNVHALRNVVVVRLSPFVIARFGGCEQMISQLGEEVKRAIKKHPILPGRVISEKDPERFILLHGMKRVRDSFCAINCCKARCYLYLIPRVVIPVALDNQQAMNRINQLLQYYEGRNSFHNFAGGEVRKSFVRDIYSIQLDSIKPIETIAGKEFFIVRIYGNGFMKHHIRGMIGLVLAVINNVYPEEVIPKALEVGNKFDVIEAPGIHLLLENQEFMDQDMTDWGPRIENDINSFQKIIYKEIVRYDKETECTMRFKAELKLLAKRNGI